jgi:hypothetical protein
LGISKKVHTPAQDSGDEETDNEMQNYEEELQQCAKAVGIHYQRQEEADPPSLR